MLLPRAWGAAASVLLLGVAAGCGTDTGSPPDVITPTGPVVYWNGQPPVPDAADAIDALQPLAQQACPAPRQRELSERWSQLQVVWQPDPFDCRGGARGPRPVHGCQRKADEVDVSSVFVLPDEVGHVVWEVCFDRTGESQGSDGRTVYDPDFAAWVGAGHQAITQVAASEAPDGGTR